MVHIFRCSDLMRKMEFNILTFFVAFLFVNASCGSRHRREQNHKDGLEKELNANLTWLNHDQIEVLHELKADGNNISILQNEMWLFYNITKGHERKKAAKHLFKYCEDVYLNMVDKESEKEWKELFGTFSNYNPKMKILQFFNHQKNGTNLAKNMSTNGCLSFIETESNEFVAQITIIEYVEEVKLPTNEFYSALDPNSTDLLKKRATLLSVILKPEEAIKVFDEILDLAPDDMKSIGGKADSLITMGRFEEAFKLFDKILEINSSDTETLNKKINGMLIYAEQIYENATNMIFENYFNSELRWLNEVQTRELRRLKAEGKKSPELFAKVSEFFESSNETIKAAAINSMEHGCIHLLYTVFGYEKANELMDLKTNFTVDFDTKIKEFLKNLNYDGQTRAANAFLPGCRKFLAFNGEEPPPIMVSFKINDVPVKFIYDTGADFSIADVKLWKKIGSPRLYPFKHLVRGVGGIAESRGRCRVTVELHGKKKSEWLYIYKADGMLLFGRDWMKSLNLKIEQ